MALIDCPSCGKKISDKVKHCPHCGFNVQENDVEEVERKKSLVRYQKLSSLQNQSMLAIVMFLLGFGFMYWGGTRPGDSQHTLAMGASVIGFMWYVVNRVRMVIIKRFSE